MAIYIFNPSTTTDIELQNMGVTIPANSTYNISVVRPMSFIAQDDELTAYISNGALQVARTITPSVQVYPATVGTQIVNTGIVPADLNIGYNNLTATGAPTSTDDETEGYTKGSLWVYGQQVWSCNDNTANAAEWYELTQPLALPGIVTGRYYSTEVDSTTNTASTAANTMYAIPLNYPTGTVWNRIGIEVTTLTGGSNIRLAIYDNNNGVPGNLVLDAGTVSGASTGLKEISISYTTTRDWFWLCCLLSNSITLRTINAPDASPIFGRTAPSDAALRRVQASRTYSLGMPSTFPTATLSTANAPFMWVRKV